MEHREPIIKLEYFAAIVHIAAAIVILATIAVLLFAMP
jgi:hypothetical protein